MRLQSYSYLLNAYFNKFICDIFGRIGFRGYTVADITTKGNGAITLSPSNIKDQRFSIANSTYISWEKYNESPEIMIFKNDIVIVKTGSTIGKIGFIHDVIEKMTINPQLVVLKNIRVNNKYLYYVLISVFFQDQLKTGTAGGSTPAISQEKINNFVLPIPIKEQEQTAIANYLDHKTTEIDTLIEQKKQLIVLYKEERTATINHAVTGKLDVCKMSELGCSGLKDGQDFNNPINQVNPKNPSADKRKMKDSGIDWIGEIPEHWEVKRLKYLGSIVNGNSFKSDDFVDKSECRVMKISNIQTMKVDWTDDSYLPDEFFNEYPNHKINKGDLVFALTRPIISTGIKATIVDEEDRILLNQRNAVFRPIKPETNRWLYYIILSSIFLEEFDSLIDKTGQQPNISSNDIANISIPLPPVDECLNILGFLESKFSSIDSLITNTEKEINLLQEYKTALISEVVLGKVDVREETV